MSELVTTGVAERWLLERVPMYGRGTLTRWAKNPTGPKPAKVTPAGYRLWDLDELAVWLEEASRTNEEKKALPRAQWYAQRQAQRR